MSHHSPLKKENTTKKWAFRLLKSIVLGLIIFYIVDKIQWQDQLVDHTQNQRLSGDFIDHWSEYPLRFSYDQKTITINAQNADDYEVSPGFFSYLKHADIKWLIAASTLFFFGLILNAYRFYILLNIQTIKIRYSRALVLNWIGLFFNNFLPGATGGDVMKAYYVTRHAPDKKTKAVLTVIVDRLLGLIALMNVAFIAMLFSDDSIQQLNQSLWLLMAGAIIITLILFNQKTRTLLRLNKLVPKHPKVQEIIAKVSDALTLFFQYKRQLAIAYGISLISHLITICAIYFISMSIGMGVPIIKFYLLVPIIFLVSSIPIAPSGWGIGEALFAHLFGQYASDYAGGLLALQITQTRAIAVSILFRIQLMLWSVIGGFFYFQHRKEFKALKQQGATERDNPPK